MRKYTFSAPANAVSGKWYPIVFRRSGGSTDELASRVVITTYSSAGGYAMNNCEFNGFVMPGGWFDRGSYAAGFFSIYSTTERAIHSIISSAKDDDLCSVFYVEARAFPINIFAEEGLNVIVPTADYAVGQTTYKWGATDPLSESTNAQIILDFKNGRGYYCSHPFISSLSGNAATATKLQTACTINGVSFDGTKDITLTPKDLDAYSKSEVQSALAGKQPLDNTLTNLSGKDVAGLLAYLGLGEGSALPVGVPVPWPSATPPTGWLKCNGAPFSAEEYPELAKAYPTNKLPDLRGEFIRGWDDGRGIDAGREILSAQGDAIRNITGTFGDGETAVNASISFYRADGVFVTQKKLRNTIGNTTIIADTPNNPYLINFDASRVVPTASENRPRNIAFNYIVRAV
ncbi:phage tail protein [Escherichia coli]|uniref:phage tail protein n=1 Tax=Escherichia coli TaxID=562 RepID=UPI003D6CFF61